MTTFVGIINRQKTFTIDGYSNAKTLNGVRICELLKETM